MRQPNVGTEERKKLSESLRTFPTAPYATQQAIYADFCKVKANSPNPSCTRLKQTQATLSMRKWYCEQGTNAENSNWCKAVGAAR